jgi:hypothetical protein
MKRNALPLFVWVPFGLESGFGPLSPQTAAIGFYLLLTLVGLLLLDRFLFHRS